MNTEHPGASRADSRRYVPVATLELWRGRALVAEAALANRVAIEAELNKECPTAAVLMSRVGALMDAKDAQIRELESKLLTALQLPAIEPAYLATVAWYETASAPAETWLLVAAQFEGPNDWRVKMGHVVDGKWVVLGGSWTPTRWTYMPAGPGTPAAMYSQEPVGVAAAPMTGVPNA